MHEYIAKHLPLKLDLQLFAEGGEGGEEGGTGGEGGSGASSSEKTFTQTELDQHVQSRLSRAEKAAQKQLAKDLGFDSVEAMQAALKPKDKDGKEGKLDPAEVDRLVDEKIKAREKEQNDKTFKRLLNAEVKLMANELGFADWEDAAALADLSAVKENDKGDLEGVKEALEALSKKKPHLLKAKQGSGRFGADIHSSTPEDKKKRHEDIANLAKSRGAIGGQAVNDPWTKK
ncbi:scaffolding protein [Paenibacillus glucanolyticus]|uniref:scaffolding protein n=1 Tax=Paenibacillus glucanolyticus TaxID=59843 RepID=UPI00128DE560|nr:scaffolding protein [Paenibacillus glucanolyticus]MPY20032.1 scaffolding protein [Paenibacillus glucanolyticus]